MTISQQILKDSARSKSRSAGSSAQAEIELNQAFDGLNRCKLRAQSVPVELGDLIADAVNLTVDVYTQARQLYRAGHYPSSAKLAKSVCRLCNLLNNLAEEQTENILKLPPPPAMHLVQTHKPSRSQKIHPSLSALDSFVRQRVARSSKFYKSRLSDYSETLSQISKHLTDIKRFH